MAPQALLSPLHQADGSATYSANGYSVIGAVNGPVEVSRRDELPEEAAIEVIVRPAAGVGSPRERHLESLLRTTLQHIILTRAHPRTLIQLTLQITSLPDEESAGDGSALSYSSLPLLPPLLTTALLALLSASIPLSTTLAAALVAISATGKIKCAPTAAEMVRAGPGVSSLHVFAFSAGRALVLAESEGDFEFGAWEEACAVAEEACCERVAGMEVDGEAGNGQAFLRGVVEGKVGREMRWRMAV
ncbi:uncharacterized protein BDZ99DRAFT_477528 [Mytilinidion resinicola]|uniref:Exoribonuclease phosphorolytic domain-containing protein n=1 Tax=Mytilinidion resinicola TaxID=574789 RepID=A0A6A6YJT2_9PEZI|nr:uncharacterized protein BDZ99DRAFT_477528 [Mytilinidion resinicola]KAF2809050.1 hypothetical protein BDZ99DRAFT_477528 [Mytilinidion resinicola]